MAPDTLLIGHRGASYDAPENTVAALQLAWNHGAMAVEFDVRLTLDGVIVLLHDDNLRRTAGLDASVAQTPYAQVAALDAGSWKDAAYRDEAIPTLGEALATVPPGGRAYVEIKCGEEILEPLVRQIEAAPVTKEQITLICFDRPLLAKAKALLPQCEALWLHGAPNGANTLADLQQLFPRVKTDGLDGLDLGTGWALDEAKVAAVREAGLQLCVWTVNDAALARQLVQCGVSAITTDRPAWLREQLSA